VTADTHAGDFLVATPLVGGAPFWQSVVLLLEHDESGAIGVILNAQTEAPVSDHVPALADLATAPATVFVGGPVQTDTALVLVRSFSADFLRPSHLGDIGLIDPDEMPDDVLDLRVYAGYSGWDPGQLEAELEEGAWWVLPADRDVIFTDEPQTLWDRIVATAPGRIPLHRTFPVDLTTN
jgi:putative transcriptional regulator